MNVFQAVILGVVQGLTEFLPVSSSGHLAVVKYFFNQGEMPILFDILLHVSTLSAVCIVFGKKIAELCCVLFRFILGRRRAEDGENLRLISILIIATAVTAVAGFLLKDLIKGLSIKAVPLCFIFTGFMISAPSFIKRPFKKTPGVLTAALITGAAQGLSVFPGISRSGAAISAAQFAGFGREKAGEFSFLLSIPVILGAFILELGSVRDLALNITLPVLAAGIISAFAAGLVSLIFLLKLIKKGKLGWFAAYLIPLGISLEVYLIFFSA